MPMLTSQGVNWEQLRSAMDEASGIPWQALAELIDAVIADNTLWRTLAERFDQTAAANCEADLAGTFDRLFALYVLMNVCGRLDGAEQRELGRWWVAKVVEATGRGDDVTCETLVRGADWQDPLYVVPPAIEAAAADHDLAGPWTYLWSIIETVRKSASAELRERVRQFAMDLLGCVDAGHGLVDEAIRPAVVVGILGCVEALPLLERLLGRMDGFGRGDLRKAIEHLNGDQNDVDHAPEPPTPLRMWLVDESRITREIFIECDQSNALVDRIEAHYHDTTDQIAKLLQLYRSSDHVQAMTMEESRRHTTIARHFLKGAFIDLDVAPSQLDSQTIATVITDLFPMNMVAGETALRDVPAAVTAFIRWLSAQGVIGDADALLETVEQCAPQMLKRGLDPTCWGRRKRIAMRRVGKDDPGVWDEKRIKAAETDFYDERFNQRTSGAERQASLQTAVTAPTPEPVTPQPFRRPSPKVGRNDPCPCGSGKKYKKCCGA